MIRDEKLLVAAAAEMETIVRDLGLDCYEQVFEWITPGQMAVLIARDGSRLKYPHWSYGKEYRRRLREIETFRDALDAHERVLNGDPCTAYLVENTVTPLAAMVIAHVYGHNDFFKHNAAFRNSNPRYLLQLRAARTERVWQLMDDPAIGEVQIEETIEAARTLMYHRTAMNPRSPMWLEFLAANSPRLEDWERELMLIVNDEAKEELRYIQTKTANEGWASYWEMEIISRSTVLPYALKDEAARFHANLTAPPPVPSLGYNPYNLGMLLWRSIRERLGRDALFAARREELDVSLFSRYLTQEVGTEANLAWFEYGEEGHITRVVPAGDADPDIWAKIKSSVIATLPIHSIPVISCAGTRQDELAMAHFHDGRDLDIKEAKHVLCLVAKRLWKGPLVLRTMEQNQERVFRANENGECN